MRRRWKILLFGLFAVIAIVAVCFFCLREQEPSYNGRTLSRWLRKYEAADADSPEIERTQDAVLRIGTNAIPFFLKWTTVHEAERLKVYKFWARLPERVLEWPFIRSVAERTVGNVGIAEDGFAILGTNAIPAIPELERRFYNSTNRQQATIAAICLKRIGKPGLDFFVSAIQRPGTKEQHLMAIGAIGAMSRLGTNAIAAVPLLIAAANGSDEEISDKAARSLGYLGLCPEQVVPILIRKLSSTNNTVRLDAIDGLSDFGTNAKLSISAIKITLLDNDPEVSQSAKDALALIDPDVLTNSTRTVK